MAIEFVSNSGGSVSVWLDRVAIGVIREVAGEFAFVPGKVRRAMNAETTRRIVTKLEFMNFKRKGNSA